MATSSYGLEPLLWPPGGEPPDCCESQHETLLAWVQFKSIGAQKTKCGTPPIVGLSDGSEGYPLYRQPEEGPKKFFLVVTETASGTCEAGPGCIGHDPDGNSERDTSSGTKISRTNPRSTGPLWNPCVVHVEGEINDNCIWFYVNWSFNWTETTYTVNRWEGEPPPGHCKVLGSSTYTLTLSQEYTNDLLETIVAELLSLCSLDDLDWGQHKIGTYVGNNYGTGEEPRCIDGWLYAGWSNGAHRGLSKDEATLARRRLRYKVTASLYPPRKNATYRVRWREMFIPEVNDDEDPVPVFTEREFTGSPADGETSFDTGEYTIEPPDTNGSTVVVGLPARGTMWAQIQTRGWALTKRGFLEYTPTGEKPRVYKRETASGGFAGCPQQDLPAKSYSGLQRFTGSAVTVQYPGGSYTIPANDDPAGNREDTLSQDVRESGLSSLPFPQGGPFTFTMPLKEVTPTRRVFERETACNGQPVKDTLRLDLSEEYTTAEMMAAVEAECSKSWDDSKRRFLGIEAAVFYLSDDEATCAKQHLRYKMTFSIPWSFATTRSFTFKWKIYTRRFDTGQTTEESISQSVTFTDGNTAVVDEEWREIPAPSFSGRIWVGGYEGPEHPLFHEGAPKVERV